MRLIQAIKIAWRYWRSNPPSSSVAWGYGYDVVWLNPELCGNHVDWELGRDFEGQYMIYTNLKSQTRKVMISGLN